MPGSTLRLTVRAVLPASSLGEFSLQPQQGDVRAAFVPLSRLQQELDLGDRVNTLLVSALPGTSTGSIARRGHLENLLRQRATLEDIEPEAARPAGAAACCRSKATAR